MLKQQMNSFEISIRTDYSSGLIFAKKKNFGWKLARNRGFWNFFRKQMKKSVALEMGARAVPLIWLLVIQSDAFRSLKVFSNLSLEIYQPLFDVIPLISLWNNQACLR